MNRTGVPCYAPRQVAKVFVTIDREGEAPDLQLWRGSSKRAIQRAAREAYPSARLSFGRVFYVTI